MAIVRKLGWMVPRQEGATLSPAPDLPPGWHWQKIAPPGIAAKSPPLGLSSPYELVR